MKRQPWMKFWVRDWLGNPSLRGCSMAARGMWVELMALMHEAEPYGHLLVNGQQPSVRKIAMLTQMEDVAEVARLLKELEDAGMFCRREDRTIYCPPMVRQEEQAEIAREYGRRGGNPNVLGEREKAQKAQTNQRYARGVKGRVNHRGKRLEETEVPSATALGAASRAWSEKPEEEPPAEEQAGPPSCLHEANNMLMLAADTPPEAPPTMSAAPLPLELPAAPVNARKRLWGEGLEVLREITGITAARARPLMAKWLALLGDDCGALMELLLTTRANEHGCSVSWVTKAVLVRAGQAEPLRASLPKPESEHARNRREHFDTMLEMSGATAEEVLPPVPTEEQINAFLNR